MASFIVERLQHGVDSDAFKRFRPVYLHALAVAREVEYRAAGITAPEYPPLVELLAQCAPEQEAPF